MQTLIDGAKFFAFWGIIIGTLIIIIAGVRDRVVIYFDKKDFWISFLPWVIFFMGLYIITPVAPDGTHTPIDLADPAKNKVIPLDIIYAVITLCMIEISRRSIYYNRSFFLGLCIAPFKVGFSIFAVIGSIGSLGGALNSSSTFNRRALALALFAILHTLWEEFINGRDVYKQKGWVLPDGNTWSRLNLTPEPTSQANKDG